MDCKKNERKKEKKKLTVRVIDLKPRLKHPNYPDYPSFSRRPGSHASLTGLSRGNFDKMSATFPSGLCLAAARSQFAEGFVANMSGCGPIPLLVAFIVYISATSL